MLLSVLLCTSHTLPRREFLATTLLSSTDPMAKPSAWGLAPPPIAGKWSYEELLDNARAGRVATVQIAVQHDCVVSTTTPEGARYATLMPDADVARLELESLREDGTLPFRLLPMDEGRAKLRLFAGRFLLVTLATWTAFFALQSRA